MSKTNWTKYPIMKKNELKNFNRFIEKSGEHDLWIGYTDNQGYGQFNLRQKPVRVHTLALVQKTGIPEDRSMICSHLCSHRNCTSCVEWKNQYQKKIVEKKNNIKLNEDQIMEIRREYSTKKWMTMEKLRIKHNVSLVQISNAIKKAPIEKK